MFTFEKLCSKFKYVLVISPFTDQQLCSVGQYTVIRTQSTVYRTLRHSSDVSHGTVIQPIDGSLEEIKIYNHVKYYFDLSSTLDLIQRKALSSKTRHWTNKGYKIHQISYIVENVKYINTIQVKK
jgi:hypothetical protein